jgi:hypothetical protein
LNKKKKTTDNAQAIHPLPSRLFVPLQNSSYHRHTLQSLRPIVEQAHQTLKVQLQRQEGGHSSPAMQINKALFTLNFLIALNLALLQLKNIGTS